MEEPLKDAIERTQRELAGIRDYHQEYLNRRANRGTRTATDLVMNQHQQQLASALDLLEALKAMNIEE